MKRILLIAALMLVAAPTFAASKVQQVTSPGGITAWLIEEHGLPLLTVKATFTDAGTASDPKGKEGRATMADNLLGEGAGKRDALAFSTALEERAIRMDFSADEDLFSASVETLSEHKQEALSLLADALTRPRFDTDAIERIRRQRLTVLKQLGQSPHWLLQRAWQQAAFPNHPYGQQAAGTEQSIKSFTRKDFETFRQRYLTRGNVLIAVVGDITPEELKPLLDTTFGGLPKQFAPEHKVEEVMLPPQGMTKAIAYDMPQTLVTFGLQGLKRSDPAYFDAMVLNYIVGGGDLNSRLAAEVREKRGLAYSIQTMQESFLHGATWAGSFSTRTEEAANALQAMRDTIAQAKTDITAAEVERAKRFITGSFVLSLDTNSELAGFLISMQLNKLGPNYLEERNAKVEAATLESVRAVAQRLLDPERFITFSIGKTQEAK